MDKNWILDIGKYEEKVYSQKGQDGVLDFILKRRIKKQS